MACQKAQEGLTTVYTLTGHRVTHVVKPGIYVRQGRKVMVR